MERMLRPVLQVAAPGAKSAVSDCILLLQCGWFMVGRLAFCWIGKFFFGLVCALKPLEVEVPGSFNPL